MTEDTSALGDSELETLVKNLRQARQHKAAAAVYLEEAQQAEEHACYVANWGVQADQTHCNPVVQQLLQHAHTLKQKADQEVS